MDEDFDDIDEKALRKVERIDRCIEKLRRDDQGAFMALTNALEYHLEISPRNPEVVRLLARALDTFCHARGVDPKSAGFAKSLHDLLEYS